MTLLRLHESGPEWPYTVAKLRSDEPRLSVSSRPHAAELAALATLDPPVLVYEVLQSPPPAYDTAKQRVVQVAPELVKGQWFQRWEVEDLPPPPPPEVIPGWVAFGAAVLFHPSIRAFALANPVDYPALVLGFGQAAQGDSQTLMMLWPELRRAGLISPELAMIVADLAGDHHLPAEFIAALTAPA